jgi:alkanesulfonate monooxygenase SsuD/methylene tetrahydromethanopterin reductase-like flavin-dependent oxidoreductase (luciferase family)
MTRVGLMLPPHGDPADYVDTAVRAERQGFDFVACGEHVFFNGPMPNAFVSLAAVAGATRNLGLLSAVTIVPQYSAPMLAKLIATLDRVSHGRFEFGAGVGGEYPLEFQATDVPLEGRGRRTDESLEVVTRLLQGHTLKPEEEGSETPLGQLRLDPLPYRGSVPPVWVGGRSEAAIRRASRIADWWLPYLVTPDGLSAGLERARSTERLSQDSRRVRGAVFLWLSVDRDVSRARAKVVDTVSSIYRQDMRLFADKYLPGSDPAGIVSTLDEYIDAGAEAFVISPACPPSEYADMVDLLSAEVLPYIADGDHAAVVKTP